MTDLTKVNRGEVYRYLGVKGQPEAAVISLAEEVIQQLAREAAPRFVYRPMLLAIDGDLVKLDNWQFESHDLAQHLRGCDGAMLFAATLGSEVDRVLSRDSVLSPARAVTGQAAAAAMIEQYCDDCCEKLAVKARENDYYLRPRFSPGYGDFSLEEQPMLLSLLDAQRKIGLLLTGSKMLTPIKSVTAVIGLTKEAQSCHTGKCATCPNRFCVFRKDG